MTDDTPLRFVLIVVMVVQTAISALYLRRAKIATNLFRNRQAGVLLTACISVSYAAYVVGVLACLVEPSSMVWSAVGVPLWIRWIGIGPLLFGGVLVLWGLHDLGPNITISPSTKEDHWLVTTGALGWVRHPIYSGTFVESVGICLLLANWFVSLSAGVFCAAIAYRTRLEEKNLVEKFGDEYQRYMQQVGRFLPKLRG